MGDTEWSYDYLVFCVCFVFQIVACFVFKIEAYDSMNVPSPFTGDKEYSYCEDLVYRMKLLWWFSDTEWRYCNDLVILSEDTMMI